MPHKDAVTQQFGRNAEAYRMSPVHAQGTDLAVFRETARGLRPHHAVDIGCGAGHAAFAVAPFCGQIDATDGSAAMLAVVSDEARRRGFSHVHAVQAHAEALPYTAASVDLVTCRYSAHHWLDLRTGLHEIRRILRTDATFVVTDSAGSPSPLVDTHLQAAEVLRDPTHVRSYRVDEWENALNHCGFAIENIVRGEVALDFPSWVARANTPALRIPVICDLLTTAPREVRTALAVREDGSFRLDIVTLVARAV